MIIDRPWDTLTDEELLMAHRTGDPQRDEALSELFRRYHPRIAKWCVRFTQDRESALDLAQDVLLRAYRSLHTYRGDSRFSTWLYVIARNQCCSAREKLAVQPPQVDSAIADTLPDQSAGGIHEKLEAEQLRNRNWQMIMKALSPTEANVMMLHYGEDVPLADITRALGLSNKSGAKAYIVSARRKLSSLVPVMA